LLLSGSGVFLAYLKYRPKEVLAEHIASVQYVSVFSFTGKILKNNWYIDKFYYLTLVKGGMMTAKVLNFLDRKVIDGFVNLSGILMVVIANIIAFADKYLIDGLVVFVGKVASKTGDLMRSVQTGRVQGYLMFTILIVLVILVIVIFI
ncbi:MAG: hypothetical protein ACK4ND_05120, partial [Cytophagaceae bacterium]